MNWITELEECIRDYPVTLDKACKLSAAASHWPTCACGQLCKNLPREVDGAPLDARLRRLGFLFMDAVESEIWKDALDVFHQIEARTAELLKQQEEKI